MQLPTIIDPNPEDSAFDPAVTARAVDIAELASLSELETCATIQAAAELMAYIAGPLPDPLKAASVMIAEFSGNVHRLLAMQETACVDLVSERAVQ